RASTSFQQIPGSARSEGIADTARSGLGCLPIRVLPAVRGRRKPLDPPHSLDLAGAFSQVFSQKDPSRGFLPPPLSGARPDECFKHSFPNQPVPLSPAP